MIRQLFERSLLTILGRSVAFVSLLLPPFITHGQESIHTIANPLQLHWPWELVHVDVPVDASRGDLSVRIGEELRPAQVGAVSADGKSVAVWFIATLPSPRGIREAPHPPTQIAIIPGKVASPLQVRTEGDHWVVENGIYEFRVPSFKGFKGPRPAKEVPTILGGVKRKEDAAFFGKSWFEGEGQIQNATTEIVVSGPVFVEIKVTYHFVPGAPSPLGEPAENFDQAKPVVTGNSKHDFYEATLRFVMGDPWVDVTEKYRLPAPWTYFLELKEDLKPDTAMFIPWFSYERFGGNNKMEFTKLEPRAKQRGPFVAMRPRWSQMPGGGMDFIATRGGPPPSRPKGATEDVIPPEYDPNAPAVGVIATHPILWFEPYAQTLNVYCENGDTARVRFPLGSGGRSYAIVCASRDKFDNTGKLNSLVRRHTDWTLEDQMHQYILEWPRKSELAGPHILITREELKRLQDAYASNADTPDMAVLKEFIAKRAELKGTDAELLKLILGEADASPKAPPLPNAQLWLGSRYQDDFLNPTSTAGRSLAGGLAAADLASRGQPIGGASQAALGYIFTDIDNWPGYHNGWGPGNPNFHTDKYLPGIYAAAAMLDHPHAKKWLEFGERNFNEDKKKVLLAPDGVGYECPGYSGYSLNLQVDIAKVLHNAGYGNPIADDPLYPKSLVWHRNLLTPVDLRLKMRHEAPIGDTHRWTSGANEAFGKVAKFIKDKYPVLASEFMGTWKMLRAQGMRGSLVSDLIDVDQSIPAMAPEKMDWGSHAYFGFGAILRSRFGTPRETFVTFKAGPAAGHYHNDELSYHFYGDGTPLSLDYNCSYHPRGDHAALHNSMTFGITKNFTHTGDAHAVEAVEQLGGVARVGAFQSSPAADIVVAERTGESLSLTPVYPQDAKFQYPYPSRKTPVPITHRRYLTLVKHAPDSKLADYLVVRDETRSADAQQLNIHLLTRDVTRDGPLFRAKGQWDTDAVVFLANSNIARVDVKRWYYYDEYMMGPEKWPRKDGKITNPEDLAAREEWQKRIHETDGEALIPPVGWKEKWTVGEYQKWLRIGTAPGTPMLWVLYPKKQNAPEPKFESLADGSGVRLTLGNETDEIWINSKPVTGMKGQAVVRQNGTETVLLKADAVPPLGEIKVGAATQGAGAMIDDSAPARK